MKRSTVILIIIAGILVLGTGYALWDFTAAKQSFVISGFIEADDIHVGSKVGGRVLKVVAKEGQTVKEGETLVLLEPRELDASLAEAQATFRQLQAKHALLTSGFRQAEIKQADAAAKQAQAELDQFISGPQQHEIDQTAADRMAAKAQAENAHKFFKTDGRSIAALQETVGLEMARCVRGSKQAIKPTLANERIPSNQNIVGSSVLTSSNPTIEVDVVFDTC